ncbi:MAG TPA: hypothetical protein VFF41_02690 [Gallionella sp.]|nr:hypothetical protein [Gallionella sp.]
MAKTNYTFEKRKKEIAKKQKQEQKRLRKVTPLDDPAHNDLPQAPVDEIIRTD